MSKLEDDLKNLKDDALSKKDAEAAIRLVAEVCGWAAVMGVAATVISALFGPAGLLPAGAAACHFMMKKCNDAYSSLDSGERALVRKLVRALKGVVGG